MRHCNNANKVGDVIWYDSHVKALLGGNGLILEIFSKADLDYEEWLRVTIGSSRTREEDLTDILLRLQCSTCDGGG